MSAPYREQSRFLLCPRCGEVLDVVFREVTACTQCQGVWIPTAILDAAFGNPRWPGGHSEWWRNELECPECAADGIATTMDARTAQSVTVDWCRLHGLWLDRGELGRLMMLSAETDELGELQRRITAVAPDPEELLARRNQWRTELEARRRAATQFRGWVQTEQRRKAQEREAAARRQGAEANELRLAAERSRARELERGALIEARDRAVSTIRRGEARMIELRDELYQLQLEVDASRAIVKDVNIQLEAGLS